ncbi:MAG TPA: HAD-IIA family hydrolase [Acidimicrobiia bacterium]|nr:HAD-IIA family hydrolase [Acidimicrobiia bacterium]
MTAPVVCCDLDGVIWRGDEPIAGAAEGIAVLRAAGRRVVFVTNNSSGTRAEYVAKLESCGVPVDPADVLSSAMAAARLLAVGLAPGARVLSYAGPGVHEALGAAGFQPVEELPVDAVVAGFHRDFDFDRLAVAADAVRAGARFVATNVDATYPTASGLVPGTGALVAALEVASGRRAEVAGKPHAPMAALVREVCGPDGVMIGDRPSSDGVFAVALGWPFALVLSGIAGTHGEEPVPDPPPEFVAADLGALAPQLLEAAQAAGPRSR